MEREERRILTRFCRRGGKVAGKFRKPSPVFPAKILKKKKSIDKISKPLQTYFFFFFFVFWATPVRQEGEKYMAQDTKGRKGKRRSPLRASWSASRLRLG